MPWWRRQAHAGKESSSALHEVSKESYASGGELMVDKGK
jgi:hypothetical protein